MICTDGPQNSAKKPADSKKSVVEKISKAVKKVTKKDDNKSNEKK